MGKEAVLSICKRYRQIDNAKQFFTNGGCYAFYRILKSYYSSAEAYYNMDHIIVKIDGNFYDITGEVSGINYFKLETEPNSLNYFENGETL